MRNSLEEKRLIWAGGLLESVHGQLAPGQGSREEGPGRGELLTWGAQGTVTLFRGTPRSKSPCSCEHIYDRVSIAEVTVLVIQSSLPDLWTHEPFGEHFLSKPQHHM